MRYVYDSYTNIGNREKNEDSFYIGESENGFIFAVADGLGGHNCGELASAITIQTVKQHFYSDEHLDIAETVLEANRKIIAKQKELNINTKSTIAVAHIQDAHTIFAHVGDSRIYAFLDGKIVFQSIDHSVSQMAVLAGEIQPNEIRMHEDRNILVKSLGVKDNLKVDINMLNNDEYDAILICSDGFWEYVFEDEMCDTLLNSESSVSWLKKMRRIANERMERNCDNNTAIVIMKETE